MRCLIRIIFLSDSDSRAAVYPNQQPLQHGHAPSDYGTNARLCPLTELTTTDGHPEADDAFSLLSLSEDEQSGKFISLPFIS